MEKAREIRVKADEEFAIEKVIRTPFSSKVISDISSDHRPNSLNKNNRPSTVFMRKRGREQKFLRKCERPSTWLFVPRIPDTYMCTQSSAQSTITNKSRLQLLHKREEILQQIFASLREPSTQLCDMPDVYEKFLEDVIAESLMHIMEPSVVIHCRKSDVEKVETAAAEASQTYKNLSKMDISFSVLGSMADEWYAMLLDILRRMNLKPPIVGVKGESKSQAATEEFRWTTLLKRGSGCWRIR